jgi:D-amino-acid oxidase
MLNKEDDNLPPHADWGISFTSMSVDPTRYLSWMLSNCHQLGVKFMQRQVSHIYEGFTITGGNPQVVINATGLGAATLGGVEDKTVVPIRGQLVIVENDSKGMFSTSIYDDEMDENIGECMYIINRPNGMYSNYCLSLMTNYSRRRNCYWWLKL